MAPTDSVQGWSLLKRKQLLAAVKSVLTVANDSDREDQFSCVQLDRHILKATNGLLYTCVVLPDDTNNPFATTPLFITTGVVPEKVRVWLEYAIL